MKNGALLQERREGGVEPEMGSISLWALVKSSALDREQGAIWDGQLEV